MSQYSDDDAIEKSLSPDLPYVIPDSGDNEEPDSGGDNVDSSDDEE